MFARWLPALLLFAGGFSELLDIPGLPSTIYESGGDVNIGGLFPLHQPGRNGSYCGSLRELGVLQRAEAMAFYIDQINRDTQTLPNVTLGYVILDDCYKEMTALARGLQFVQKSDGTNNTMTRDVVAVVGAESSTNSKQIAELLGLFEIPQVSYLSTNYKLTDKFAYPYFTRIVPSDTYQIEGMVHLLKHFNWSYVSFVYTRDLYGLDAYLLMRDEISKAGNNICLAAEVDLEELPSAEQYRTALERLRKGSNGKSAHVVILFLAQVSAINILKTAQEMGMHGQFTWIASDAWGRNIQDFTGVQTIAEGAITFKIQSNNDPEFDDYFSNLNPYTSGNPFALEFWRKATDGVTPNSHATLTRPLDTTTRPSRDVDDRRFGSLPSYRPETTISLVKVAVYLIASKLHHMQLECLSKYNNRTELCYGKTFRQYVTGKELRDRLRGTYGCLTATGSDCVNVDREGEGKSKYSILNLQKNQAGDVYTLEQIGHYDTVLNNGTLVMDPSATISWNSQIPQVNIVDEVPLSICSRPCGGREQQVRSVSFHNSKCCWHCEACGDNEITTILEVEGLDTIQCQTCERRSNPLHLPVYTAPHQAQCEVVMPQHMGFASASALAIIVLDGVIFLGTLFLLILYIRNRQHRLIKATSLELSYVIWSGILFSYITVLFYFVPLHQGCPSRDKCNPKPLAHWCYIQYVTFSLSSTLITAPMITRANRIYRIFRVGKKYGRKPKLIGNKYQFTFVGVLMAVQVAIVVICCLLSHLVDGVPRIEIRNSLDPSDIRTSYIFCDIPFSLLLPPVAFNFLLGLVCTYQAFKTRKLPDNFNESRFIGMTIYTTVVIWLAFIPAYITISTQLYKVIPLVMALLVNAIITTACLFVPRLYALRWVDRRRMNLRSLSMSLSSTSAEQSRASAAERPKISAIDNGKRDNTAFTSNKASSTHNHLQQQMSSTTTTEYQSEPSTSSSSPDRDDGERMVSSL